MRKPVFITLVITLAGCSMSLRGKHETPKQATDEGSTGSMHDAHLDRIVFASSEISRDSESPTSLTTSFRADEAIWTRYFMSKSLAAHMAAQPDPSRACQRADARQVDIFAQVGSLPERRYRAIRPGEKVWSYYTTSQVTGESAPLIAEADIFLPQDRSKKGTPLLLAFAELDDGTYPVRMRVEASCLGGPAVDVATGAFDVIIDQQAREALVSRLQLASALYKDPAETERLRASAVATFTQGSVQHFRILEPAWRIEKNDLDIPLFRRINTLTLYQEGASCSLIGSEIKEVHQGGGSYAEPIFLDDHDGRLKPLSVPCSLSTEH